MDRSSNSTKYITPFKWAGSKNREMKKIKKIVGSSSLRICEPFLGTGVVSNQMGLDGGCIGNDLNKDLIGLFNHCTSPEFEKKASALLTKENMADKDLFYSLREEFNEMEISSFDRAVLFFFLQNCAHFGLYRIGKNNRYTSTWHFFNKEPNFELRMKSLLETRNKFFQLDSLPYKKFLESRLDLLAKMDLIFVDPPYLNSSYGDYSVGEGEISPEDFKILDSYCSFLYKKYEVCSIICNYETEMDNELYVGSTNIVSYVSTRSMNLNRYTKRRFNYVLYGFGNSLL